MRAGPLKEDILSSNHDVLLVPFESVENDTIVYPPKPYSEYSGP